MNNFLIIIIAFNISLIASCDSRSHANKKQSNNITSTYDIEIYDNSVLNIIDSNTTINKLTEGFLWSEGPLWVEELESLLFSDVPRNRIYMWNETDSLKIYLESSGHTGEGNLNSGRGSNGLILDKNGKLLICQHGDQRIVRMDASVQKPKSEYITIANSYKNKAFNSPNDMVMDSKGNIYFTDPPYGRPDNKTGELGFNGVYRITPENEVIMLLDSLNRPNGIGLSKDEKTLYVNHSDPQKPVLYSFEILDDGSLKNGKVHFNFSEYAKKYNGLPDGLKVHSSGNIFATGPGGVHIISPEGSHLALIKTGKSTSNCAFDSDYDYLFTTTTDELLRVTLVSEK